MPVATRADVENAIRMAVSFFGGAVGSPLLQTDPGVVSSMISAMTSKSLKIESGVVLRSGCTSYDCAVKIGKDEVGCNILSSAAQPSFGTCFGSVPVEGTWVFVLRDPETASKGWVIGSIPLAYNLPTNGKKAYKAYQHYWTDDFNIYLDNASYNIPFKKDSKVVAKIPAPANRPGDVVPGDLVCMNENACGILTTEYMLEMSGGASFVTLSRLDDEIHVRSTNMRVWTDHEARESFNDGGYISSESREYSYEGERLGDKGLKLSSAYKKPKDTKEKTPRPRVKSWMGFLGNVLSWFALRPKDPGKPDQGLNKGLTSVHVSQAGNVMVRAAGGVAIERYDRIPVPERITGPWDPEGDRESKTEHKPLEAFEGNKDPHARGLELSDRMAWEYGSMYKRFDELKKDFKSPNESELEKLKDDDEDPMKSSEQKLSECDKRRAGVYIGNDGSVIIRDAWGSEIVMVGGNVTVNTPGNVITTAHKNVATFAGNTVSVRGKESVDIVSEDKSKGRVRLSAQNLVEIAGGTDGRGGGVLIESLGKGKMINAAKGAGDTARIQGVVIRSEKSGVSIAGKSTYVTAEKNVFVTGGKDGATRDGSVFIDGKNVVATVSKNFVATSGPCTLFCSKKSAVVYGSRAAVAGGKAIILNGSKVPSMWAEAEEMDIDLTDLWTKLQNSDVIKPYSWDQQLEKALFSFRTSAQAKTNSGIEPWKKNGKFTMYQPHWQVMVKNGGLVTESPVPQVIMEVHGSKQWPYTPSIDSGVFKTVESFKNVENGMSKDRDSLEKTSGISEDTFSNYKY